MQNTDYNIVLHYVEANHGSTTFTEYLEWNKNLLLFFLVEIDQFCKEKSDEFAKEIKKELNHPEFMD